MSRPERASTRHDERRRQSLRRLGRRHDGDHRWAFGTGFTDPLEGIDTSVPAGIDADALADLLPDARRRRADLLPPPAAVDDPAARARGRDRAWPTSPSTCSARPGCCWPAPAPIDGPHRGRARVLPRRDASSATSAWSSTRDDDFAELVGRLLVFSTWRLALFERLTTCADPVLAAIAAKGVKELTYHRDYAAQWVVRLGDGTELSARADAGRARRALAAGRRAVPRPHRRRRWPSVDRARRSTPCSTPCWPPPGSTGPTAAAAGRRSAAGPAATACTPRRWATCWPSCRASPAPTRTRHGERRAGSTPTAACGGRPAGDARPRAADGHARRPRHPARASSEDGGRRRRDDHADLLRLPGHARDQPPTCSTGCSAAGYAQVDGSHRSWPRRGRSDWITAGRPSQARRGRHRPAAPRAAARRPVPLTLGRAARGRLPALRLDRHPRRPPRSARRPASRCTAAPAAASRSSTIKADLMSARPIPPADGRRVDPLTDDSAAVTFAVPDELRERLRLRARAVADPAARARSAARTRSAPPAGRPPRIGVREVAGGAVSGWLVHERRGPATWSRCRRRPARSPPTSAVARRSTC